MRLLSLLFLALLAGVLGFPEPTLAGVPEQVGCASDAGCSLNGVCGATALCDCDPPWSGPRCGAMAFAETPAAGKDLYNISDPRNTWNGPIAVDAAGKLHMYNPLYNVGSLGGPPTVLHGVADSPFGPWDWHSLPPVCTQCGENPAALVYTDAAGKDVHTLWIGGSVWTSPSAAGPFNDTGFKYVGGNPAPIWHNGAFYLTNQHTTAIYRTESLDPAHGAWVQVASVNHSNVPAGAVPEDPYMWVDKRGNWHIINHAYDTQQVSHCGQSVLSTHFFSSDGKEWQCADDEPYGHTVHFDDGTSHTYTTLERPNIHFNASGQMTHLGLAADLVTGDEGCADRGGGRRKTCCTNCKYTDHAGTLLVKLAA